ncbi:MAG: hypothetical protein ACM3X6_03450 [Patescibacteria group bacterium]
MTRIFAGCILSLVLVLALGGTALASPLTPAGDGNFVIFGEYACDGYMFPSYQGLGVGVGYGITDCLTIGAEAMFMPGWTLYGAFINAAFGPVLVDCDVLYNGMDLFAKAAALYCFEIDALKLAFGGGIMADTKHDYRWGYLEASASLDMDPFSIYGKLDYALNPGFLTYELGFALTL